MSSNYIQECIDKNVLDEFKSFCNGTTFSPLMIRNEKCFGNGKKIVEKLTDKINTECPDLHASYSSKPFHWYYTEWRVETEFQVDVTQKQTNYQTYPDEETLSLLQE